MLSEHYMPLVQKTGNPLTSKKMEDKNQIKGKGIWKLLFSRRARGSLTDSSDVMRGRVAILKKMLSKIDNQWVIINNWDLLVSNAPYDKGTPSITEKGKKKGLVETYNKHWIGLEIALRGQEGADLVQDRKESLIFIKNGDWYASRCKTIGNHHSRSFPVTLFGIHGFCCTTRTERLRPWNRQRPWDR